ncbi:MAG: hypothetical protein KAS57_04905 [Gammaproteobacteria bacterium]|nr:hypothetical protein [Gammaproteobacteria bacterium]
MLQLIVKKATHVFLIVMMLAVSLKDVSSEEIEKKLVKEEKSIDVCEQMKGEGVEWFDEVHRFLSVEFCEPSVWFDSFFSDDRIDEEVRAGTHVRWQNDYVLTKGGTWAYLSNISASFKLPRTKKKLHIVFEGEEEESLRDVIPGDKEETKADLGLLYEITESERANFSVRVKLSPSILFRYRYQYPVSDSFSTRFTQEWYRRDNADGNTSRLDFEKKLYENFLLRQSNSVEHSESFDGEQWQHSLVLYQRLTDKSALSYESSMSRVTAPTTYVTNSRLGVRFRKNFYRKWLFYEIAPAYNWPRTLVSDERERTWEILFRLEVNFVNL